MQFPFYSSISLRSYSSEKSFRITLTSYNLKPYYTNVMLKLILNAKYDV